MAFPTAYHADSDADDEYERSVMTSPQLPTDSEASPTDSEPPSAEHTPTTFGAQFDDSNSPRTIITEWTAKECADFLAGLGLRRYSDSFMENEVVGEALVALTHEELKEIGITSVGHRLTILKSVYETKIKQDIPIDPDHYVPPSVEQQVQAEVATQDDIARIINSIRIRDERIAAAEAELRKMTEDYRRLREEMASISRSVKPLPYQPSSYGSTTSPEIYHDSSITSPAGTSTTEKSGISRTLSKKLFHGGMTPKNNSPTYIPPQSIPENRSLTDNSNLDPSAAAMAASHHLTASMNGGSQPGASPGLIPSPTSPASLHPSQTLNASAYAANNMYDHPEDYPRPSSAQPTPPPNSASIGGIPRAGTSMSHHTTSSTNDPNNPPHSVEIFKSFRVSMEDPCHKVLPAALKKYNINDDPKDYALYIVYGDEERCLGLEEKPLILFKKLQRENRKPMFMLRRHLQPVEGYNAPHAGGAGAAGVGMRASGYDAGGGSMGSGRASSRMIQLPGGVL